MTFWGPVRTLDRNNSLTGNPGVRATCLVLALGVALLIGGSPAEAAISPPGCNANGVSVDMAQVPTGTIANNTTVVYTATVSNNGSGSGCDTTVNVVTGFCPDNATGLPSAVPAITYPTIANLPQGNGNISLAPSWSCLVNLTTALPHFAQAKATLSGNLQDSNNPDPFSVSKTVSVTIAAPPPTPTPTPTPPPQQIPTLSEWVFIMLGVFLVLAAGVALRRKRIS
jgi:hypothetical protein